MSIATIRLPGRVWEDYLDPLASGMQADIGLSDPKRVKRGRGWQAVYENVPEGKAQELAEYLFDRGDMLVSQDPENAGVHRAAMKAAEKIREMYGL